MALIFRQLGILLWKCWIFRRRHYISTIFELFFPLLLVSVAIYLHSKASSDNGPPHNSPDLNSDIYNKPYESVSKTQGPVIFPDPVLRIIPKKDIGVYLTVVYSPNDCPFIDTLMKNLQTTYLKYSNFEAVSDEREVKMKITELYLSDVPQHTPVGFVFNATGVNECELLKKQFVYKILMSERIESFQTDSMFPYKENPGPFNQPSPYITTSFAALQTVLNQAYLSEVGDKTRIPPDFSEIGFYRFPYPKYVVQERPLKFSTLDLIAVVIVYGYLIMGPIIVKRITDEKVAKGKEMLRMMGMSDWVFWFSHFLNYFIIIIIHGVIFTILFYAKFKGGALISFTNYFLFFFTFALWGVSIILFCMVISTVFNRPVIAVIVTIILWIVSFSLPNAFLNPTFHNLSSGKLSVFRILSTFLPNMGLSWALSLMGQQELYGDGAQWTNLFQEVSIYGSLTVGLVLSLMIVSCFLYIVLIWYLDAVWPWQYGVPKPFWFCFLPSYWSDNEANKTILVNDNDEPIFYKPDNFEPESTSSVKSIRCINLRKEFGYDRKVAVNCVNLNICHGQITVLLGHNGAGKTTTMNMITGIFPCTKGYVFVDGYNVASQTKKARRSIGLCPQENVLYDELTVEQHLKLYAALKGHPFSDLNREVEKTLKLLQLSDKQTTLASSLSGGMKRKLSLGIAMIANTKILILDEPTSGMDPEG